MKIYFRGQLFDTKEIIDHNIEYLFTSVKKDPEWIKTSYLIYNKKEKSVKCVLRNGMKLNGFENNFTTFLTFYRDGAYKITNSLKEVKDWAENYQYYKE